MKTDYMKNLEATIIACNREAFLYRDGKAWDNKKCKTYQRYVPRGKVYMRLVNMENRRQLEKLQTACDELKRLTEV